MSKITDMLKAWTGGTLGGGGADLSAVDEDVTVLNEHKIELRGSDPDDPDARASLRFADDAYSIVVEGTAGNGESDLVVLAPGSAGNLAGHWIALRAQTSGKTLFFVAAGEYASLGFNGGDAIGITGNLRFVSEGTGPIVASPDHSLHRLIVGDDGTVSSEPVV